MASLRSVIQREIIAVKHALANNTAHEGIVGDDLKDLLKDLQAYRAEVIARSKSESTKSMKTFSVLLKDCKRESDETAAPQSEPKRAKFSRVEIPRPGDSNTSKPPVSPEKTEAPPKKIKIASVPKSKSERGSSSTGGAGGAGGSRRKSSLPKKELQVQDSSKKSTRTNDLRQLRRDIQVGDIISVLLDIRLPDRWVRTWVRGEVLQNMTRGGIFQIAFDHDKAGGLKGNPAGQQGDAEDIKWIHEQRLEIESRHYFCGKGSSPPRGIDSSRPKGSWYLHDKPAA